MSPASQAIADRVRRFVRAMTGLVLLDNRKLSPSANRWFRRKVFVRPLTGAPFF
ncbi:MAG: hypothetical protein WBE76_23480 [Terracidiphilus sp.]